jgi:hypothetical protein
LVGGIWVPSLFLETGLNVKMTLHNFLYSVACLWLAGGIGVIFILERPVIFMNIMMIKHIFSFYLSLIIWRHWAPSFFCRDQSNNKWRAIRYPITHDDYAHFLYQNACIWLVNGIWAPSLFLERPDQQQMARD